MAHSTYIATDYYNGRPYSEEEYVRDPSLTILEELQSRFKNLDIQSNDGYLFTMKNFQGKELTFTIYSCNQNGHWFFGWKHERFTQTRTWHYICKDILGYYSHFIF